MRSQQIWLNKYTTGSNYKYLPVKLATDSPSVSRTLHGSQPFDSWESTPTRLSALSTGAIFTYAELLRCRYRYRYARSPCNWAGLISKERQEEGMAKIEWQKEKKNNCHPWTVQVISIKGNVRWIAKLWLDLVPVSRAWFSPYTGQIITVCQLDEHINWISFWLSSVAAVVVIYVLVSSVVVAVFHKALNFRSSDWPIDPCFANRIGIARQIVFIVIIANANIPNPSPSPSQSPLRPNSRVGCLLIVVRLISKLTQMIVIKKNVLIVS